MSDNKVGKNKLSRRDFIRNTSIVTAGSVVGSMAGNVNAADQQTVQAHPDTSKIRNYNPKMGYRRLGKTNLMISEISLGGHWANRKGGRMWMNFSNDEVPEDVVKNRTDVVSRCIERGINYVDITNSAECLSYGAALKGRREKMYVAASDSELSLHRQEYCTVEAQMNDIESCLRRFGTDYLDIWRAQFRHDGGHPDSHIEAVVTAFEKAHDQGKVRWLGMSTHTRSFVEHIIEKYPQFSMVIFPYMAKSKVKVDDIRSIDPDQVVERGAGVGNQGTDDKEHTRKSIFDAAKKQDVGIVTIKPFGGGSLFRGHPKFGQDQPGSDQDSQRAALTLAYILCNPMITATIPGMTTVPEVDNNVRASAQRLSLLDQNGMWKLCEATDKMWANLPANYRWLHDWEWV